MECTKNHKTKKHSPFFYFVENLPLIGIIIFGILITMQLWWGVGILYGGYSIIALLFYMKLICPYCCAYTQKTCASGYHIIAARFFNPKKGKQFYKQFQRYVPLVYPLWFFPIPIALFSLYQHFSWFILFCLFLFCLIGFVILPLLSKKQCKQCKNAVYCPRMLKNEKN